MPKLDDQKVNRWRAEVKLAIAHQAEYFGEWYGGHKSGVATYIEIDEDIYSNTQVEDHRLRGKWQAPELPVNQIKPNKKQFGASSYYQNPKVIFSPARRDDEQYVPILEKVVAYYQKELNFKEQYEFAIDYAYLTNLGCIESGYWTDIVRQLKQKQGLKQALKQMVGKGEPIQYNEYIRGETPFQRSIFPFDILFPAHSREIANCPFIIRRVPKDMTFIHNMYPESRHLKGFAMLDEEKYRDSMGSALDQFKQMVVYEIFLKPGAMEGIERNHILTFLGNWEGITESKPVAFHPLGFNVEGTPFSFLQLNKNQHSIYGVAEPRGYIHLQHKLNLLYSRLSELVDKFNIKIPYSELVKDEKQLKNSRDNFVKIDGGAAELGIGQPRRTSEIPAEIIKAIEMVKDEVRFESGLTEASMKGVSEAEFATTEKIGQAGMQLRSGKASDRINEFVVHSYRKFVQILRQFVSVNEVRRIVGDQGINPQTGMPMQIDWKEFGKRWDWNSEIRAEYDIDIDITSMQKPNPEKKRVDDVELLDRTLKYLPILNEKLKGEGYDIRVFELYKNILKDYDQRNIDKIIVNTKAQQQPMGGMGGGGEMSLGGGEAMPPVAPEVSPVAGGMGI